MASVPRSMLSSLLSVPSALFLAVRLGMVRACRFFRVGRRVTVVGFWAVLLSVSPSSLRAEWTEETYSLEPGWNAIWVSVDAGYTTVDTLLAAHPRIEELWLWNSLVAPSRFSSSGEIPAGSDSWLVWRRGRPDQTSFTRLKPNAAYLVRVADTPTGTLQLRLTGRPLPPRLIAQSTGVNLVGFPVQPATAPGSRSVDRFFSFEAAPTGTPELYHYVGGPLSDGITPNPRRVVGTRTAPLQRGRAYWVNSTVYSEYYGPLRVTLLDDAVDFGTERSFVTVRIRNVADALAAASVSFTLSRRASATPPSGQSALLGDVPVLVRGPRDPETLQSTFTALPAGGLSRTLQPGEETELVLGVDRSLLTGPVGSRYASILQIADSLNLTRIDLPVTAVVPSSAGVWIGSARIDRVDQIIGNDRLPEAHAPGGYELRLILHRAANGQTTLLQKVFVDKATGGTARTVQPTVTTGVSRISSAAFPLDLVQPGTGQLAPSGVVSFPVSLAHNAPTNPFVHTYHPDHDGLDARFVSSLPAGQEAPTVNRSITLTFSPAADNGETGWGSTVVGGTYRETVSGLRMQDVTVSGQFILRRVSDAAVLSNQP